ncbi:MAG: M20/M25/M40 family metallo-hydrolase [Nitrososphaeraceae archaeon]|nr:M20/M25/M40 family metallo-hydrolase [Nitrososphaeraceae archaeon]
MNRKSHNDFKINQVDLITDLQTLIRQPSVSAKNIGMTECAIKLQNIMTKAGIATKLIYPDQNSNEFINIKSESKLGYSPDLKNDAIPPIVYGEIRSKKNPDGKTILFYNHYDVQPEDPVDLWENKDPFSGKIHGNFIYGRGSSDDKGEIMTRIKAVEYLLKKYGDIPCNVKFLIEGEEEIGSPHIKAFLNQYKELLHCDGVIWEFGYFDEKDRPLIILGVKGILYVEIVTKGGPSRDVHSSLASLIENPAWIMVNVLKNIRSDSGRILIPDWYREMRPFSNYEITILQEQPFDEEFFKKEYGIDKFLNNLNGFEAKKYYEGMPTCNISGLYSGFSGKGSKTVLPNKAVAKIDFRLVPDMDPDLQFKRLCDHLEQCGFTQDMLEIKLVHKTPPARNSSINNQFISVVEETAKNIFDTAIKCISSAATGPMYYFMNILDAPCVCIGSSYKYGKAHAPNEYARLDLLLKTTEYISAIIENFGKINRKKLNQSKI